jgi:fibro-slime domain-containing protein
LDTVNFNTQFNYTGGEVLTYIGDDSVWVFINGILAVDIGGVHGPSSETISLDTLATTLKITKGKIYPLDFFFAEEHTCGSTIQIQTTFVFLSIPVTANNSVLPANNVTTACNFFNNTLLDNSNSVVMNTNITLSSVASIRVTFLSAQLYLLQDTVLV